MLLIALAVFLSGLVSTQNTEQFTRLRNEALDDLRLMANTFAKEARQASAVTTNQGSKVVMTTNINAVPTTVTWEVVTTAGVSNLRRETSTSTRVFVVRLVSPSIFTYNNGAVVLPADVRTVKLGVATKLSQRYPSVSLATEVSLRNVE